MTSLGRLTPPAREYRDTTRSYTTDRIAALTAASTSGPAAIATATAAVEVAAGMWGRALSLANVSPQNPRTRGITPGLLELAGRALARRGQVVFDLEVNAGGDLVLLPCASASVLIGSPDPRTWIYTLNVYGPSSTITRYRPRDGVLHLQAGTQPDRPWHGRAPWQTAHLSGALLAGIERQLAGEAESASGYVIPMPDVGDKGQAADADGEDDPLTTLRRDMAAARGKTLLVPSLAAGLGAGPAVAPTTSQEYMPRRFGADPPESPIELRRDIERSILSCYGVLPSLFYERAAGTALREAGTNPRQLRRRDRDVNRPPDVRGAGRRDHADPSSADRHGDPRAGSRIAGDRWGRHHRSEGDRRNLGGRTNAPVHGE